MWTVSLKNRQILSKCCSEKNDAVIFILLQNKLTWSMTYCEVFHAYVKATTMSNFLFDFVKTW